MYIDKTNEVMMNYYKKQEMIKAKQRLDEEKMPIVKVLQLANKEFITTDELLEALYISKGQVLDEVLNTISVTENTSSVPENTTDVSVNTTNVSGDTPMEIAKIYKDYYERYNHDRKQICKDKKIANGTFQKYEIFSKGLQLYLLQSGFQVFQIIYLIILFLPNQYILVWGRRKKRHVIHLWQVLVM